ncbi:MAG: ABC transporter permease [Epsilonproteobacteria bacterium]|nr:MAG: ABC transporter permease [Campylobacterota bacterium]
MQTIPLENLLIMLLPLIVVGYVYTKWLDNKSEVLIATLRMVIQLLLIGYVLSFIFKEDNYFIGLGIILMMIFISSWIVLRNIQDKGFSSFLKIAIAIAIGGTINLTLVIVFVLDLNSLYEPRFVIPIAGMIYSNAMNAVSLAAERFEQESSTYIKARQIAFKASMIPQINAFLAVGLVSLPGMMTGQILSGVDPLIAVRYQIVVMAMVLGSSGISVILYLLQMKRN